MPENDDSEPRKDDSCRKTTGLRSGELRRGRQVPVIPHVPVFCPRLRFTADDYLIDTDYPIETDL